MAVLDIIIYPDPLLKEVSEPVEGFGPETDALVRDLVETMRASPGVGLAAVQIGTPKRIIAVDVTPRSPGHGLVVLANPEITEASGRQRGREGCLSVPEYTANIKRPARLTVRGLDALNGGRETAISASGFEARALAHEIDHLDGILFIDRITDMKRDLFRRKDF